MPKMTVDLYGMKNFQRNLRTLANDAQKVMKFSLFDGAAIAGDELRAAVNGLDRVTDAAAIQAWLHGVPTILCVSQKNGLRAGLGITPMKVNGKEISVKIGFDGYNQIATRRWPNGQPNQMIAASCEHGSSAMLEQPFIRPAYRSCAARIRSAMEAAAKKKIEEILDE